MGAGRHCYLLYFLSVCCLVSAAGCRFHRTGNGFVIRGQWSLEWENLPRLSFNEAAARPEAEKTAVPDQPARPELLPWRGRLRGYRIAGRLFGREQHLSPAEASSSAAGVAETEPPVSKEETSSQEKHSARRHFLAVAYSPGEEAENDKVREASTLVDRVIE